MKSRMDKLTAAVARALAVAAFIFALLPATSVEAQTVTKQPFFIQNQSWTDLGNGPNEIFPVNGSFRLYSSSGSGTGGNGGVSGSTVTLTASAAANPPCVGCIISGPGITSGTTVTAFNGTTTITMSANMAVQNGSALAWGVACPASGAPAVGALNLSAPIDARATAGAGDTAYPMFTQARLCGYGDQQAGGTALVFTIGAW